MQLLSLKSRQTAGSLLASPGTTCAAFSPDGLLLHTAGEHPQSQCLFCRLSAPAKGRASKILHLYAMALAHMEHECCNYASTISCAEDVRQQAWQHPSMRIMWPQAAWPAPAPAMLR